MSFSSIAPLVETAAGPVRGYHDRGLDIFKGIPYGRARRFRAPEPVPPWKEPLDATSYGCVCPLLSMDRPGGELRVPHRYWVQDEDCLNLNLWTPGCGRCWYGSTAAAISPDPPSSRWPMRGRTWPGWGTAWWCPSTTG